MRKIKLAIGMLFCFVWLFAQNEADTLRIMSYNVENYFDTRHDSLKNDYEFLPEGSYHWTVDKFKKKQAKIAQVITAVGAWNAPALVGLIEIENDYTLKSLVRYSPLKNLGYNYIHKESPDARGIDVALLYQPKMFEPISEEFLPINFPDNPRSKTRDILYASGKLKNGDTLHVFVNHFPSRLGGEAASEPRRLFVASVLRAKVDSIFTVSPQANILIMGDFNDFPNNKSINSVLGAVEPEEEISTKKLYNLMYSYNEKGDGSYKYQGQWNMLDQIIVSGPMLQADANTSIDKNKAVIFKADFLVEKDEKFLGEKPFRTYIGMKYNGGYSDHFPVYIDLILKKTE
ncbi:MAG: endonuclease [Prevotellaceae bacterium]|jgi:predicted extracellular nuclease|nr:endonuclease [Prevotellaceae bacterium]